MPFRGLTRWGVCCKQPPSRKCENSSPYLGKNTGDLTQVKRKAKPGKSSGHECKKKKMGRKKRWG